MSEISGVDQFKQQRAETMLRRALLFNTPASRAEMLTTAWIGLDDSLRDAFVLGLITRVAVLFRDDKA
ncbi:MAG: hypothetical protein ABF567_01050 [Acetobacter okinawensis]